MIEEAGDRPPQPDQAVASVEVRADRNIRIGQMPEQLADRVCSQDRAVASSQQDRLGSPGSRLTGRPAHAFAQIPAVLRDHPERGWATLCHFGARVRRVDGHDRIQLEPPRELRGGREDVIQEVPIQAGGLFG